jgi:ribosomal protein S18 acetylase RimI-like enzyme
MMYEQYRGETTTVVKIDQTHFQVKPVRKRQHFLFNLPNFLYFRKSEYEDRFLIEGHPLSLFIIIPYLMFSEVYFFKQHRYFVTLRHEIVGVFALQERAEALYIGSVAVSPFYRKIGVATYILNYAHIMTRQLGKSAVELSVLKTNLPALRLYRKSGFREKKEKRRSFILGKDLENVSGV